MAAHKNNLIPVTLSVLIHVVFGALFVATLEFAPTFTPATNETEVDIIEAVAVDESKIQRELDKLKKIEERKRLDEEQRQRALESDAQRVKRQREDEEQRLAEVKKKKEQEKQTLLDLEKKKKADTERLAKEQATEQDQLKKLKKEREQLELLKKEDQKRADELALKRKMEEEQAKERTKQEQVRKEQERKATENSRQVQKEVSSFEGQIKLAVSNKWNTIALGKVTPGSSCKVAVTLLPTGEVINADVTECTGGDIFKRSVEDAVSKASPLPVSKDPAVFDKMREITFVFAPASSKE